MIFFILLSLKAALLHLGSKSGSDCFHVQSSLGREVQALQALREILEDNRKVCVILSGKFLIDKPLRVAPENSGSKLMAVAERPAEMVGIGGVSRGIEVLGASNVTIDSIKFSSFASDGVYAKDSTHLTVKNVIVSDTKSKTWSQGAIHLTGNSYGARLENNTIQGADYAGLIIDTYPSSDISESRIIGNSVADSCRQVKDCGAIYVNDRGRRSRNIVISNNNVVNFGPANVEGRGIYVDDWASHVTVRNNRIAGPGQFAFQIHGGHDNLIIGNTVDMTGIASPLLYQAAATGVRAMMTGNVVADNVFAISSGASITFPVADRTAAGAVRLRGNRQCVAKRCSPIP